MFFHPGRIERLADLANRLNTATEPSSAVLYAVLSTVERATDARQRGTAAHIALLIECGAWTEASLELLNVCGPSWQLSRLLYDSGEWHCRLSPQRELPDWLGQTIETRHEYLAVALLKAAVEASQDEAASEVPAGMRTSRPASEVLVMCENFF